MGDRQAGLPAKPECPQPAASSGRADRPCRARDRRPLFRRAGPARRAGRPKTRLHRAGRPDRRRRRGRALRAGRHEPRDGRRHPLQPTRHRPSGVRRPPRRHSPGVARRADHRSHCRPRRHRQRRRGRGGHHASDRPGPAADRRDRASASPRRRHCAAAYQGISACTPGRRHPLRRISRRVDTDLSPSRR